MKETPIKSTKSQIEDFKESLLWDDFKQEIHRLFEELSLEYDLVGEPRVEESGHDNLGQVMNRKIYPSTSETLIHLGDIKGRKKALRYFLSIPDILLSILEDQNVRRNEANRSGDGE